LFYCIIVITVIIIITTITIVVIIIVIIIIIILGSNGATNNPSERRLRVLQKGVLTELFVPKKDQIIREWRRLRKKELYDLYWPDIILVI
jgi:hypothetical protein